jgi:glycosyltransferase involved in cell wall biosynthesis
MHAAKPVICTITGGAKEMVEKNITGTYITTLFLEQAATLSLSAFDERIGPDYGKCGKERVEEYFTREAYEKNMLDVIETI